MLAKLTIGCFLLLAPFLLGNAPPKGAKPVVWTGWFADSQCASARASAGTFTGTNPVCAKTCIQKGIAPVFLSEQAKAIFGVQGYPSLIDDLGFHLEITGTVDEATKTVFVQKVRRLQYDGAACSRTSKADSGK